jgi:hypothetical protein
MSPVLPVERAAEYATPSRGAMAAPGEEYQET